MAGKAKAKESESGVRQRVARIHIENVMGIELLDIEPGKVTVIEGANASGKTSALEAIKAAIGGGNDATLIRKGADRGEVVLLLEDGTEIRKVLRREGAAQLTIEHPDFGQRKAPQSWLNDLADAVSVNPVAFLTADAKRQTELLLEAAAFHVEQSAIQGALGPEVVEAIERLAGPIDFDALASWKGLQAIDHLRRIVYDARTGVNRLLKERESVLKDLRDAVPADPIEPEALKARQRRLAQQLDDAQGKLDGELDAARADARGREQARTDAMMAKIEELQQQIAAERAAAQTDVDTIRREMQQALDGLRSEHEQATTAARTEQAALNERIREAEHAQGVIARVAEHEADVEAKRTASELFTASIERLDALKGEGLAHVPIPNLELRDGLLYANDIPLHRINHAKLVELAFWVAKLRAGALGVVCVDGLEALDEKTFAAFTKYAAEKSDLQYIVTRVGSGPLSVRSIEAGDDAEA